MNRARADVAILGSGFAGSLMALMLERAGRRAVLLERDAHPRFAIGESSTPLANLALEEIAAHYDLPWLRPLAEYGSWRRTYPDLPVGLKRGFSFFRHAAGRPFEAHHDHANELLVAASPADDVGDTHWFRESFDGFLVEKVKAAGIDYRDRVELAALEPGPPWQLRATCDGRPLEVTAEFLVDASGTGQALARLLSLRTGPGPLRTDSWAIYNHFTGVRPWREVLSEAGGLVGEHPYPCDAAAVHHVLEDAWVWVLAFDHGLTSAGVVFDGRRAVHGLAEPEAAWEQVLRDYPSLARQFAGARTVRPWTRTGRLQRCAERMAGQRWAMLAGPAGFVDPMFSAGNAHALRTAQRLAHALSRHWRRSTLAAELRRYEATLRRELLFLDRLVHGCQLAFRRFDLLVAYSMYYFAGAVHMEEEHRAGRATPDDDLLYSHHDPFRRAAERAHARIARLMEETPASNATPDGFQEQVARDIASINTAGLCDPSRRNLYPFLQA